MSAEHEEYEEKDFTEPDNVNAGLVGTITVVGAILVLSIALALTALVRSEVKAHSEEVSAFANLGAVSRLKAEQTAKLEAAPAWADQTKGLVRLPIAEALKITRREWQNPAQARSNLIARVEKATALPPKAPEKPSEFE